MNSDDRHVDAACVVSGAGVTTPRHGEPGGCSDPSCVLPKHEESTGRHVFTGPGDMCAATVDLGGHIEQCERPLDHAVHAAADEDEAEGWSNLIRVSSAEYGERPGDAVRRRTGQANGGARDA